MISVHSTKPVTKLEVYVTLTNFKFGATEEIIRRSIAQRRGLETELAMRAFISSEKVRAYLDCLMQTRQAVKLSNGDNPPKYCAVN